MPSFSYPGSHLRRGFIAAILLATGGLLPAGRAPAQLLAPLDEPAAALDRATVPAAGRHHALLTVKRFGRYAVTALSDQGVALQLVDRMAGPGRITGRAGEEDGRLDVFLDRGEYKIVTRGHEDSSGEAALAVHASAERNPQPGPQLVELKPVAAELGDFQQLSYWLEVKKRRFVHLEAAGRHLRDLRLWLDGNWLVDGEPATEVLDPRQGQPLLACRLALNLEPGLYLVTAYGGREQPWADDRGERPFHLRLGIPRLGTAGRARYEVSPFGIDRYRAPARASFFRLELPEARLAVLRVGRFALASPFAASGTAARIEKTSRVPAAEVTNASVEEGEDVITVEAEAGQPYVLQHFEVRHHYRFERGGNYWISSIHSGHPEDSVDATAILAEWTSGRLRKLPLRAQTVTVGPRRGWATRANLTGELNVFVQIESTGSYLIESEGTDAEFRFEPFFVYRPPNYQEPPFRRGGEEWELEAGYYVLTVRPLKKGIVEMALKPRGLIDELLEWVGLDAAAEAPVVASVRFPAVQLGGHHYEIFLNRQPEVQAGIILRGLPMSLNEPLPLTLRPGDEVSIPFTTSAPSRVEALAEDGTTLAITVDGGRRQAAHDVGRGEHSVSLRHDGDRTVVGSLRAVPLAQLAEVPLPPLPAGTLEGLPEFPLLTSAAPAFFDLDKQRPEVFLVQPEDDALYRLETTGLLDTEGKVRSRVVTSLATSASGGSGRNFFLHQFLNAGDYQLVLHTRGLSRGHLGLELTRTDPLDGGELRLGLPARIELAAGGSVAYRFDLAEAGRYRLRSFALGHTPRCRLEDSGRWPIVKPGVEADFDRVFEPGTYRLLLLPEPVDGRRLTLLERVEETPEASGHGPHPLALDTVVRHRWHEPEPGGERTPDVWHFELPGASEVSVWLTGEMHGRIRRRQDGSEVAYVPPARGYQGPLPAGTYRFEVECFRRNNRVDYTLGVRPEALLPGLERAVTAPATLAVAVGRDGLVEITSFGATDVGARLVDSGGRVVARGDDRAGDWNFHLAARLAAGRYTLQLKAVGAGSAATTVRLDARDEVAHDVAAVPFTTTLEPGSAVHTLPLELPPGDVLLVAVGAPENVGLAVERQGLDGSWETVASRTDPDARIELPLAPSSAPGADRYRLRLWSVDRRGNPVRLSAAAVTPIRLTEAKLARGASLRAVKGFQPAVAVAAVELSAPGTLLEDVAGSGVRWSGVPGTALETAAGVLQAPGRLAWIAMEAPGGRARPRARRVILAAGSEALQLPLTRATPSMVDLGHVGDGPVLVLARSMTGQPAVRLEASGVPRQLALTATAITDRAAAAVALASASSPPVARAWLAQPAGGAIDVRLRALSFDPPSPTSAGFGRTEGELGAAAAAFDLPPGNKRLRLVLTGGLVAAVVEGGEVASVHWNGGRPLAERFVTRGERLLLLRVSPPATQPTRGESDRYAVEVLPAAGGEGRLAAGSPVEVSAPAAGSLRVRLEPGGSDSRRVEVFGAGEASFWSDQGTVLRGSSLPVGAAGGTLRLPHPPGLLVAWVASGDERELDLFAGVDVPEPRPVDAPARVGLDGPVTALAFEFARPALLSFDTGGRAVYRLTTAAGRRAWIDPAGGIQHAYVPAGPVELAVRSVADKTLAGELDVVAAPVSEVGEGLGPEVLLAPGGAHAFHFTVRQAGPVGVGVRADSDTVECELLTADGRLLGRDVVQMHDLAPGDYLLVARLSPAGETVRARPAVVGLEKPPPGPPEDVIRRYLAMEGEDR